MLTQTARRICCLGCLPALLLLAGCRSSQFFLADAPTEFARLNRHLDIPYGQDPRQKLDVYAPQKAANLPVVIFWYGGSWVEGNKSEYRFVGTTLAERGFVAVLPDYRLYPQVTFPAFDVDAAHAVAWVEHHIQEYGGDPTRIVVMGHSAGGHTAAFMAYNHAFLEKYGASSRDIVGMVGLSGTYGLVPDTDELKATFPPPYTVNDWQPIRFVDAQSPPTLILHGLKDTEVNPSEAIDLDHALLKAHRPVEMHLYKNRGHADTVASFAVLARWRTPAVKQTVDFIRSVTQTPAQQ